MKLPLLVKVILGLLDLKTCNNVAEEPESLSWSSRYLFHEVQELLSDSGHSGIASAEE